MHRHRLTPEQTTHRRMCHREALPRIPPSGSMVTTVINKDGAPPRCSVIDACSILSAVITATAGLQGGRHLTAHHKTEQLQCHRACQPKPLLKRRRSPCRLMSPALPCKSPYVKPFNDHLGSFCPEAVPSLNIRIAAKARPYRV